MRLTEKAILPHTPTRGPVLPLREMKSTLSDDRFALLLLDSYAKLVDTARYAKTEPSEDDAENVELVIQKLTALYVSSHSPSPHPHSPRHGLVWCIR